MRSSNLIVALSAAVTMMTAVPAAIAQQQSLLPSGDDVVSHAAPLLPAGRARVGERNEHAWMVLDQPVHAGRLSSAFGIRADPIDGSLRVHRGIDIAGPYGAPVRAAADGVVTFAGKAGGYGELVRIEHGDGVETLYGHLSALLVRPGMSIRRGTVIGAMGSTGRSTGNHVHFEVREDGIAVDPTLPLGRETSPAWGAVMPPPPLVLHWQGWHEETGKLPSAF